MSFVPRLIECARLLSGVKIRECSLMKVRCSARQPVYGIIGAHLGFLSAYMFLPMGGAHPLGLLHIPHYVIVRTSLGGHRGCVILGSTAG